MANRSSGLVFGAGLVLTLGLAACAPAPNLPPGPTPIPTLVPVADEGSAVEPTALPVFTILSYPARPPSAAQGQRIYASDCAQCHGPDGTGAVPAARNFKDLDYMRGETPASFYGTVTEGGGEMPAFRDRLTSDERWDVSFYVWRLSTTAETLSLGEQIYDEDCAACHGADGSGEVLGSADFTDLRQMDGLAPRDLYLTVTQGRGSMPSWQARLPQDERWAVIDYLRTFTYDPSLAGEQVGASATTTPTTAGSQVAACASDQVNPIAWDDAAAIEAGQGLFQTDCAVCHGSDGSGALPNTPDFTTKDVNSELRANPALFFCVVTDGEGAMPAFGETLAAEERWQVLSYLETLAP